MEEKLYSIGEVSKMFDLPISTLRYYDKEGILPDLYRNDSGIRKFNAKNIQTINIIECLKKSGMEIKDIKEFMKWCSMGSETYELRRNMFLNQKHVVEEKIAKLQDTLNMINYKCWYYEQAMKDGNEDRLMNLTPEDIPEELQDVYEGFKK